MPGGNLLKQIMASLKNINVRTVRKAEKPVIFYGGRSHANRERKENKQGLTMGPFMNSIIFVWVLFRRYTTMTQLIVWSI